MIISGIVKNSLVDYPGYIATVLFVPGCNYDCFYCHNRFLIQGTQKSIAEEEIMDFLNKRTGMVDAVVISGGEPTLQKELIGFIDRIKGFGYKIKLDTNGSSPSVVSALLKKGLCDYFAIDYKAPASQYQAICGEQAHVGNVFETLRILLEHEADFEVRTTVFPQLTQEDMITMAKELPIVPRFVLNPYRVPNLYRPEDLERIEAPIHTKAKIQSFAQAMKTYQPHMVV